MGHIKIGKAATAASAERPNPSKKEKGKNCKYRTYLLVIENNKADSCESALYYILNLFI